LPRLSAVGISGIHAGEDVKDGTLIECKLRGRARKIDGLQQRCSVVIIGELDWSPGIHQQVIWRVDREGQQHPVTVFFLVSEDGSDPPVMDVLGIKASEATHIVDPHLGASAAAGDEHHLQRLVARYLARTPTPVSAVAPAAEHSTELNRRFSAAECDPTRRR